MTDFLLQKINYALFFMYDEEGNYIPTSRKECFAPGERPTADNPFWQRLFYSPCEDWLYKPGAIGGYAIRLPRNELGDEHGKCNMANLTKEMRDFLRRGQCLWRVFGCTKTKEECAVCWKRKPYMTDVDKPLSDDEGSDSIKDYIRDRAVDVEAALEYRELIAASRARLSPDELQLIEFWRDKTKKQVIADCFGLTLDGVYYRERQLRNKLGADEVLRDYFPNK